MFQLKREVAKKKTPSVCFKLEIPKSSIIEIKKLYSYRKVFFFGKRLVLIINFYISSFLSGGFLFDG